MAKEKAFERQVKTFLKEEGCWTLKTWSNGVQRSGVPDLLVCCNGEFVGIELKAPKGKPSDLQLWNLSQIEKASGYGWLLYPDGFDGFKTWVHDIKRGRKSIAYPNYLRLKGW